MDNIVDKLLDQPSVWQRLQDCGKPVVLYGMGDGADKVLAAFEKYGITADGVMASDDFVRGQSFHGFTVKKLSDFESEFGDFVIALCFASQLPEVTAHLRSVAERHTMLVPSVPAFGGVLFDDAFLERYSSEIEDAYRLMADEQSRLVYETALRFYRTGELELTSAADTGKDEAFGKLLRLGGGEVYLDLGAYNGDTIGEFLHYSGGSYRRIIALEPNAKNFRKLRERCGDMENTELLQLGAYSSKTTLTFNNKAGRNSAVSDRGVPTPVDAVDNIVGAETVTYIKADVEGADYEMLLGAKNTLKSAKPKLNISAYHRFEDIFRLPLLINQINPDYKIYLRHHPYIPMWDTNLYCV